MSKRGLFIAFTTAEMAAFGAVAFMQLNPGALTSYSRV
jgi:hypothetical protein